MAFGKTGFPSPSSSPPKWSPWAWVSTTPVTCAGCDPGAERRSRMLPEGRPEETAGARVDEDQFPADFQQQGVHVQVEAVRREEGGPQRPFQLLLRGLGRPGRLDRLEAQAPVADHDRLDLPDRKPVVPAGLRAFQRGSGGIRRRDAAPGERRHHPGGPGDLKGVAPRKRRLADPFVLQHGFVSFIMRSKRSRGISRDSIFLRWPVPVIRLPFRGKISNRHRGFGISFPVDAIASERGFAGHADRTETPRRGGGDRGRGSRPLAGGGRGRRSRRTTCWSRS